jgi:polyhydroxybutyrate depolymerase
LAGILAAGAGASACGRDSDCEIPGGSYRVSPPTGWDGRTPLPAALYFHGWQQSAADAMRDESLVGVFSELGVLLVAVNGLGKTWTFPGSPSQARDDVAFSLAVLDDVTRRFPIDATRLWATGFSQGGSMTWWLACAAGHRFTAFAPVAGAFWEPMREDCAGGPVDLLHFHGLADETVPMTGRVVGGRFRQGDVLRGMAVWRLVDGCGPEPTAIENDAALSCRVWSGCRTGRELRLCLHPAGHSLEADWMRKAWAFVEAAARRPKP